MKFYSEKLDQLFDTPEELEQAEKSKKKKTKEEPKQVTDNLSETPTRKQLAAEVEAAEDALKEARINYEAARVKGDELSRKFLEEIDAVLKPAEAAVKAAEKRKYDAIKNFNDYFGAYQVTYTDAKAANEMLNSINSINSQTNRLFRNFFWF